MKQDNAIILYDPLKTSFDVHVIGGTVQQRQDSLTGEYDTDRTVTPLVLKPYLYVTDPNEGGGEYDATSQLINIRWYNDTKVNEAKRILDGSEFGLMDDGTLTVKKNVPGNGFLNLYMTCNLYDSNRKEVLKFSWGVNSMTGSYAAYNPNLTVLAADNGISINAFTVEENYLKTISAQLRNGEKNVADTDAVYQFYVMVDDKYVLLDAENYPFVNSISGKVLVLDLRAIGTEKFKVVAYHKSYTSDSDKMNFVFQAKRQYIGWDYLEKITQGKFLKGSVVKTIKANAIVFTKQDLPGSIPSVFADPLKFFSIRHYFYFSGRKQDMIEVGKLAECSFDRDIAGTDRSKSPVVGAEVTPLSEHRLLTLNGKVLTLNGKALTIQVPIG